MDGAEAVFLLWGELRVEDPNRIVPLLSTVPQGDTDALWLVVRAERLDWGEGAYDQLLSAAQAWQSARRLAGVQIDFDSSTADLGRYAEFLSDLRTRLPDELKLSATGLMDWPANASQGDLLALAEPLDEIVIQTYRHTTTTAGYERYLQSTQRLDLPFRIALVEHGDWSEPPHLRADPDFKGYVVFLLAERFREGPRQKP